MRARAVVVATLAALAVSVVGGGLALAQPEDEPGSTIRPVLPPRPPPPEPPPEPPPPDPSPVETAPVEPPPVEPPPVEPPPVGPPPHLGQPDHRIPFVADPPPARPRSHALSRKLGHSPPLPLQLPPTAATQPGSLTELKLGAADPANPTPLGERQGLGLPIFELRVVGNTKTTTKTVEFTSRIELGETATQERLDLARDYLLSVGLFKAVSVDCERTEDGSGARVILHVKDNFSWIIAPLFAYAPNNIGGGIGFAESNLFGHNKKLLLLGEYTTAEKYVLLAYLDPNIRYSRFYWRVDFLVRRDNIREFARGWDGNPRISRATDVDTFGAGAMVGVNMLRVLRFDIRLKTYYDNVQTPSCFNTINQDGSGTADVVAAQGRCRAPSSSGWDNTLNFNLTFDNRTKVYGVQRGLKIWANYQYGARWLGDNWDYHLLSLGTLVALRFFKEHNLLLHFNADVFFDPPFKLEVEVGGQETARGYVYRQYRGDTSLRGSIEYVVPVFKIKGFSLRALGFYDTSLTWFRDLPGQDGPLSRMIRHGDGFRDYLPDTPSGVVRDSWRNGIGAGVRLYLRGVILPLVGVDVGYGFESSSVQVYLAVGSNLD